MRAGDKATRARTLGSIALYLAVAFVMAWGFWFVAWLVSQKRLELPIFLVLLAGSFGPFVGAAVATWAEGGLNHMRRFFARGFDPRMGWAVFGVSFFLLPALAVAVAFIDAGLTHTPPKFTMTLAEFPLNYVFLFLVGGTLAEEYGWSLLSDKLDGLLPLKAATLLLGLIWAVWHLPLFFIVTEGAIQGYTPFHIFLIATVSMRFLFAWAYHRGGYNILSNMLFHTASNLAYSIIALAPAPGDLSTTRIWIFTGLTVASALVLWVVAPPRPKAPPPEALV